MAQPPKIQNHDKKQMNRIAHLCHHKVYPDYTQNLARKLAHLFPTSHMNQRIPVLDLFAPPNHFSIARANYIIQTSVQSAVAMQVFPLLSHYFRHETETDFDNRDLDLSHH